MLKCFTVFVATVGGLLLFPVVSFGQETEAVGEGAAKMSPVPIQMVAMLKPENTRIDFVGTHVGDEPNPRLGGFRQFSGQVVLADQGSRIVSMEATIDTTSIWTQIGDRLTGHLKSGDFLDVEKYPEATFVSSKVEAGDTAGTIQVTGTFTLMGESNEIVIPFQVEPSDKGLMASGQMMLDRTMFGMTGAVDSVNKQVEIAIKIGQPTSDAAASGPGAGPRRGRPFDVETMFGNMDVNGDGKLTGDEIPERMQSRLEQMDSDSDGALTLEELKAAFERMRANRR